MRPRRLRPGSDSAYDNVALRPGGLLLERTMRDDLLIRPLREAWVQGVKIFFIGLGTMGGPMVGNLAAAGLEVRVFDLDTDKAKSVADSHGAVFVTDAREAAATSNVVLLMLPNSDAVAAVLGAPDDSDSLAAALAPGSVVLDMGSSRPDATRAHADALRAVNVSVVDAPVSGGPVKAASGELSIMVGTDDDDDWVRVQPVLEVLGANITRTGPAGSAHAMKALNNLLSLVGLVGALEVLAVGTKFGLDPRVALDVINHSTGRNHATEVKIGPQVLDRGWNVGFSLALTVKDVLTALQLAEAQQVQTPVGQAATETARSALAALVDAAPDQSQIAQYIEARDVMSFASRKEGNS